MADLRSYLLGTLLLTAALDCSRPEPGVKAGPVDPQLLAGRQQFRMQQDARMRGELSPLAVQVGIWLAANSNT